ncbi:hypothetical protein OUZ56_004256 [Daphnia magna]|uniref:Uncharacterized protein n=1 Tax=Daphnia magna TaxID=35525 RepID=A0ABQ9YP75_9CRUS|nr:hypothetical protein OUZ56_004256 [Daphnia magna]
MVLTSTVIFWLQVFTKYQKKDSHFRDPRQIWGRLHVSTQNTPKSSKIANFPENRDFGQMRLLAKNKYIGYFWLLPESFRDNLKKADPTSYASFTYKCLAFRAATSVDILGCYA